MKSSRLRGAALAWGAILASGTVYSQAPQSFHQHPYGYPQPPHYSAAPQQPYYLPPVHLPNTAQTGPVPVNLAGQINYAGFARGNTSPTSLVSDAPMSVLASPALAPANTGPIGPPMGGENIGPGTPPAGMPQGGQIQAPPTMQGQAPYLGQQYPNQNYYYGYGQQPGAPPVDNGGYGMGGGYGVGSGYGMGGGYGYGVGSGVAYGAGYGVGAGGCEGYTGYDVGGGFAAGWYVGAYGMWLTRDNYENYTFSFDTANEAFQLTNARDANSNWDGGFALTFGHYFNCGMNALEFVYWGWYPDDVSVITRANQVAGNLNGIFNWNSLTYNGQNANVWVDNARVHALWRETEVHNFELNVLRFGNSGYGGPWQFSMIGGARIFVYEDALTFGAETTDESFDGDNSEIYYQTYTKNKLYGFQIGGVGSYSVSPRFSFNGGTKFGIYVNKMTLDSTIGGNAGLAVINNGPNAGRQWIVSSSDEDVSFLGEVFVGASYCITPRWSLSGGYRAIAVTGIAQPTDQIYPDLRGINDVASIESDSSMVLHGAYFGAQFCW